MSVYVDDMKAQYGRMLMCHMVADTSEELHAMADKIGVARKWVQEEGTCREHYDICQSKRKLALKLGAQPVSMGDLGRILRNKRGADSSLEFILECVR